jgi:hypothetical protein
MRRLYDSLLMLGAAPARLPLRLPEVDFRRHHDRRRERGVETRKFFFFRAIETRKCISSYSLWALVAHGCDFESLTRP